MKNPRTVKWTRKAEDDLDGIAAYIARDNGEAADAFVDYVAKIVDDLTVSPIGRHGQLDGTRERVLSRYPTYLIIFKHDDSHLNILRVFHTAQGSKV